MFEVLLLWFLWTRIARLVEPKGYRPLGFGLLLVSLWFIGEILGGMLGLELFGGDYWTAYAAGLLGAAVGASIAFFAASRMPALVTLPPPPEEKGPGDLP